MARSSHPRSVGVKGPPKYLPFACPNRNQKFSDSPSFDSPSTFLKSGRYLAALASNRVYIQDRVSLKR